MEVMVKEEETIQLITAVLGSVPESGVCGDILQSSNNSEAKHVIDDRGIPSITKTVTGTGVRISAFVNNEIEEPESLHGLKLEIAVKEEPDLGFESIVSVKEHVGLQSAEQLVPDTEDSMAVDEVPPLSIVTVKEEPGLDSESKVFETREVVMEPEQLVTKTEESYGPVEVLSISIVTVKEEPGLGSESKVSETTEVVMETEKQLATKTEESSRPEEVLPLSIVTVKEEHYLGSEMVSVKEEIDIESLKQILPLSVVEAMPEEECLKTENKQHEKPKETEPEMTKKQPDGSNKPLLPQKSIKDMTFEEYCMFIENRDKGQKVNAKGKGVPQLGLQRKSSTWNIRDCWLRDQSLEDGDFQLEDDWHLVGRTIVTGICTTKGWKLVDNEIVHFAFPSAHSHYNAQWIVRFSTKRFGEIGRLPMEWGKCLVPLVSSSKVKVLGRCIFAPSTLHMMQEIMLYVSFFIHQSIFTEGDTSTWRLDSPSKIDSTIHPLLTLFKFLKLKPCQKAEFTPEELDSRKRSLNLEQDDTDAAAMLPIVKRRMGCQQYPEQSKDEQAISESSLNKIVGTAEVYNLEEMEPPSTLMCELRPYQKQALYWMSESEQGIDVERAAKTLHPCWAAYRICDDRRASSIYVNIFSGEATTQFPTATQMARGGILADAMGLGKTVMTIALILARPGRGSSHNQELVLRAADDAGNSKGKNGARVNTPSKANGGTLIVCPMALLGQWKDELETHSERETLSVFVHYGGDRTNNPMVISGYDVVLTTYGVLTASYKNDGECSIYHMVDWYRVVLDEAHTIKSWKTQGAQAAFTLSSHCRWCLTGTPLQNNLEDLYSLLCFLHVEPWCNWAWWNKLIQRPYENNDPRGLRLVKAILRPLMLRRTKDTVDKEGRPILVLPPIDIKIIECEQSEAEHDFYDALFRRSKVQFDQFVAQGKVLHNYANILELLLRLRQCCNHPFLVMSRADSQQYADLNKLARRFVEVNFESSTPRQGAPTQAYIEEVVEDIRRGENKECPICLEYADDPVLTPCAHRMCRECLLTSWRTPITGLCPICRTLLKKTELITCPTESKFRVDVERNWKESSKVSKLLECLEKIKRSGSGEKSIIFSQWTSFFDLLEIPLQRRGIGFLRFDGKLVQKQRERVLKEFSETNEKMVLLMSLRAGGVGLNLTVASNVFLMDPWWNPAVEEQAIMRIHRIGQKRRVHVRRFIVKDTVEERMQQVQARKQRMIAGALTDEEVRSARIEELKMLFR
ncbi:DNA repair protein RAD5B-like isoform X1 [Tripterygium wilfordii]|uniref:DNA repair protein RAD5B-like isoform X1 n=1 Tax=Tripterygium wilfordii TaxID=458696 RepID=UPI0018F82BA3|nr:DNA repair protein RAD5B-like isoform X1 [Tripterygium wilfordii]